MRAHSEGRSEQPASFLPTEAKDYIVYRLSPQLRKLEEIRRSLQEVDGEIGKIFLSYGIEGSVVPGTLEEAFKLFREHEWYFLFPVDYTDLVSHYKHKKIYTLELGGYLVNIRANIESIEEACKKGTQRNSVSQIINLLVTSYWQEAGFESRNDEFIARARAILDGYDIFSIYVEPGTASNPPSPQSQESELVFNPTADILREPAREALRQFSEALKEYDRELVSLKFLQHYAQALGEMSSVPPQDNRPETARLDAISAGERVTEMSHSLVKLVSEIHTLHKSLASGIAKALLVVYRYDAGLMQSDILTEGSSSGRSSSVRQAGEGTESVEIPEDVQRAIRLLERYGIPRVKSALRQTLHSVS